MSKNEDQSSALEETFENDRKEYHDGMSPRKRQEVFKRLEHSSRSRVPVSLQYMQGYQIAPQKPEGKSVWARWVREGKLKATDVYWAFYLPEGSKMSISWLAVRLDRGVGKGVNIDLTSREGKAKLKEMEKLFSKKVDDKQTELFGPGVQKP